MPSNSVGLGVSAASNEAILANAKKDGMKAESTAKLVTIKTLVKAAITDSSSGGSGFPVLPVGAEGTSVPVGAVRLSVPSPS